jgi:tetratricopeptide (TPR) repeat protein
VKGLARGWLARVACLFVLCAVVVAQGALDLTAVRAKLEAGDFIGVIPKLENYLKAKPADAEAHFLLSRAYYLSGGVVNLGRASDHIKAAFKASSPRLEYYWQQGLILAAQGKVQLALSNLRVAASGEVRLSSVKDAYLFAMDWGSVAWRSGDLRQGLEAYRRAAKVDVIQPFPWLNQGIINLSLNEPERAEPLLTRAVILFQEHFPKHPGHAEANYWRGRALELLGKYEAARGAYRAALTLNPRLAVAKDALDSLGSR